MVMTVFNTYQWDLNYSNPAVFIGCSTSSCSGPTRAPISCAWMPSLSVEEDRHHLPERARAHLILQLKDCSQVTAPGVLFIAEAIVAPVEIIKYFGEDASSPRNADRLQRHLHGAAVGSGRDQECQTARPGHPQPAGQAGPRTWLNYVRCHDIGLGFDDADIVKAVTTLSHRRFSGRLFHRRLRRLACAGQPFGRNERPATHASPARWHRWSARGCARAE